MKGLMIKDLLLVKNQGNSLLIFAVCGLVMSFSMDSALAIGYMTMLGAMLAMGTLSYDEFEGGYAYLFTLPVTRKIYVRQKYLFCFVSAAVGALAGLVINLAISAARGQIVTLDIPDLIISAILSLCVIGAVMIGIVVPARLKYGSEKSRLVLFVVFGLIAVGVLAVTKAESLPAGLASKTVSLAAFMNSTAGLIAGILFMIILVLISEQISEKIMEKKEY